MAEYIERNKLLHKIRWASDPEDCVMIAKRMPASDVARVRHGSWLNFYGDFSTAECDICAEIYEVSPDESPRKEFFDEFKEIYKFCPNCGAKMDGGDEDG